MPASTEIAPDVVAAGALPRLVQLGPRLVGAVFDVMKILPAAYIIEQAIRDGHLRPNTLVVETTSGTFGLGLAMVCALRGIPLHLVSDPAVEGHLEQRLTQLGAEVTIVRQPAERGGFQRSRLEMVSALQRRYLNTFVPSQYANPNNPLAYSAVAEQIAQLVGEPSWLVGPVGSGGSMCGTVRALRHLFPAVRAAGVDTHRSVLFGQQDGPRLLRGLGNSLLPANLDHTIFDEVHWISAELAFHHTRVLHRTTSHYAGPTSGAAHLVAHNITTRHGGTVVALLPDSGHRYADTVYNDEWLSERTPDRQSVQSASPQWVQKPPDIGTGWQAIRWQRRRLSDHSRRERAR